MLHARPRVHPSQPPPRRSAYSVARAFASVSSSSAHRVCSRPPLAAAPAAPAARPPAPVRSVPAGRPFGTPVRRGRAPGSVGRHWRAAGRHRRVCREKWSREKWLYISYTRLRCCGVCASLLGSAGGRCHDQGPNNPLKVEKRIRDETSPRSSHYHACFDGCRNILR